MEKKAPLQINNTESQLHINTALPTSPPLGAGIKSTYDKERWQEDENRDGVYMEISKANPSNRVEILISGEKDGEILALEASRQVIDLIGLDAAKIQLVFAAHLFNKINQSNYQNDYLNSKFTLRGRDVIQQIGWDNRKRTNTSEKLAELASIAFHLGRMLIRCTWIEGNKKGSKVDASIDISPLWVININAKGKMDVRSANIDNPEDVYITVSPGLWADKWLNKIGQKAGNALYQFGWLATEILKIDPYHDELALKLAIHLTILSRIQSRNRNQYEYKVGTILERIELYARINAARQDYRQAYDLRQRWNSALTLLVSMGWDVIFNDETYPEWLRPNSQVGKPTGWKKEKMIDYLWRAKIRIVPPEPIPKLLESKFEPSKLKPAAPKNSKAITGAVIRAHREAAGLSQTALAEWANKTRAWLCMVEKGKRTINSKEAKNLMAGIDLLMGKKSAKL